jgi:hypothetical protein
MASDITLAVGDGARRMTYAELAQARGISLASARRPAKQDIRVPREGEFNHSDLIMISASRC